MEINSIDRTDVIESLTEIEEPKNTSLHIQPWFQQVAASIPREAYKVMPELNPYQPREYRYALVEKIEKDSQKLVALHTTDFVGKFFKEESLEMDALAIITTYLHSKKGIEGLYVCKSFEAFQEKLEKVNRMEGNIRLGLILPIGPDRSTEVDDGEYHGDSYHKMAVCVEKTGSGIKIVLLDSLGIEEDEISPFEVKSTAIEVMRGIDEVSALLWYIYHSSGLNPEDVTVYYSSIVRQDIGYGCETFAIRDAVAFLQDPQFFDKIETKGIRFREKGSQLTLKKIVTLPPAFMKGAQNIEFLQKYVEVYPTNHAKEKELTVLNQCLAKHVIKVGYNVQNHYINERSSKYHLIVLKTLESMDTRDIEKIVSETLLTKARPAWVEGQLPQTPSDAYRWNHLCVEYGDFDQTATSSG